MRVTVFCFYFTDNTVAFAFTRSLNVILSNVSTVTANVLQSSVKFSDTTLTVYPRDIDLFKNNFVVHVIISFIGVFIFFFAICVLTYVFFKCCPPKNYRSGIEENKLQTRYNSLHFVAEEPEPILNVQDQNQENEDFTYLTPVFSGNDSNKSSYNENTTENEIETISSEYELSGHRALHETFNRPNSAIVHKDDVQNHIYIEIS